MSKGLAYFKEVYDLVPGWVQKMHDYNPLILDHYTAIRSEIMQEGALSRKEKDIIIAVTNAARNYERSMIYHTKGAIDFGFNIEEIVEYFLVAYPFAGSTALKHTATAIAYALSLKGIDKKIPNDVLSDIDYLKIFQDWLDKPSPLIDEIIEAVKYAPDQVEAIVLAEGTVSTAKKHITMVANYTVQLNGNDVAHWIERTRAVGVTEAELAEVGYIAILTAGIPAWFEISDSLKERDK